MPVMSTSNTEVPLRPGWRAAAFLLLIGAAAFLLSKEALRVGIADTLAGSQDLGQLQRAAALDPDNPRTQRLLGSHLYTIEEPRPAEALEHLRRATQLAPNQAVNWTGLASGCELVGDNACADDAYERALKLGPMVPKSEWAAANHYLLTDRTDQALPHFQRLLKLDPEYDWQTFRLCVRATGDPDLVFQKVVAPLGDTKLDLSYVNFLSSQGEMKSAHQAWSASIAGAAPFPITVVEPYLARLLELGQGRDALAVWQDLEKLKVIPEPDEATTENLLYNGDFEATPLNRGFDWRTWGAPYVVVNFADPTAHTGRRCLRVGFTFPRNEDVAAAAHFIPVEPAQNYVLTAFVRSQDIASDSGPRLRVFDPGCPTCVNEISDTTVGTTPWHEISLKFSTGPETELVDLWVVRLKSRTFPMEISGEFWLDDVVLKAAGPAGPADSLKAAH